MRLAVVVLRAVLPSFAPSPSLGTPLHLAPSSHCLTGLSSFPSRTSCCRSPQDTHSTFPLPWLARWPLPLAPFGLARATSISIRVPNGREMEEEKRRHVYEGPKHGKEKKSLSDIRSLASSTSARRFPLSVVCCPTASATYMRLIAS